MKAENFKRFELKPFLIEALSGQGFTLPTDIQERLIPAIRNGRDVIGQSQTGTGKTLSFLLPILDRIDYTRHEVQAVITAPTRELAGQLFDELKKILEYCPENETIQAKLLVGGTDRTRAIGGLKNQPHIVVGTAGRIADLIDDQALQVYTASMLVVDEADQMLDMGFIDDVDKVASRMAEKLQMMVFSATIPEKLQPFLKKYMTDPRHVQVEPKHVTATKIEHRIIPLRHREKIKFVVDIAKSINPYLAIVFTNTKEQADEVANAMSEAGLNVERLHGGLQPRQRKQVMKLVKEVKVQYLVATDLAARGIDVKGVTHIINYGLPKDLDFYIHRVGRTARAGMDGLAFTIYEAHDQPAIEKLLKRGVKFTYYDFKQGEWVKLDRAPLGVPGKKKPAKTTDAKATTTKKPEEQKRTGGKAVAKARKVKPAYKKKARFKQAKEEQRQRRIKKKK
ncbi:DEAD/DEAH box helicase [Halalkalibacter akibai]|uniref:ATP-dependent RNA helicase YqfR n=1 Tax=Halalkalibacter akibai (strain ATCC 43226 / DSM 21942 / CIP 109018 / JCM 9157 / 1139) TaxID=1236973 RepID=W4QQ24_HALA3|nr:DEAD/DEAH box helicase [Halalkalibacter akibai]GAE33419.1 ATP-dependent RNA helicase YqfR [Halalkalibacter akibai JCM 9157]